jgi:methionyl-tRNA synthetase
MVNMQVLGESYNNFLQQSASQLGISASLFAALLSIVAAWALIWKGLALWKAAKKKQKIIFVLLLIINDFGIVELIYYFWLSKIGEKQKIEKQEIKKKKKK